MKDVLKNLLFAYLSIRLTEYIIGGYFFGSSSALVLFVFGIAILYYFMRPLLKILGMPERGPGFIFISFLLILLATYVFTLFIPFFWLQPTVVAKLIIFGFVLPSKSLTAFWSMIFSSLLLSVFMLVLNWLCRCKK